MSNEFDAEKVLMWKLKENCLVLEKKEKTKKLLEGWFGDEEDKKRELKVVLEVGPTSPHIHL